MLFDDLPRVSAPRTHGAAVSSLAPLAERLRPNVLEDIIGQEHLTGAEGALRRLILQRPLPNLILWGPPGCGKTTLARIIAAQSGSRFVMVSAVSASVSELKKIFEEAREHQKIGKATLVMVDEIHRFNRAQQDVFLPVMEDGTISLIGATTENPSFELNAALLSRARVLVLHRLSVEAIEKLMRRAEAQKGQGLPLTVEARQMFAMLADGDGRYALQLCDELFSSHDDVPLTPHELLARLQKRRPVYDKHQESHYNLISALHKSLRGSDVDAALYWCARMIDGGEDPLYIARRLIRFASEDIGMADPNALIFAVSAKQTYEMLGSPEGDLAIQHLVIYLATAPKSNAAYVAFKAAKHLAEETGSLMPPAHILNAPTKLMQELGYGKGYAYDHDTEHGFSGQNYFPEAMARPSLYAPKAKGFEKVIEERMSVWKKLREAKE